MDILQFKQTYIEEASILLLNLDNVLLTLEKDPANLDCINEVFRIMHTLKGTSSMYGFDKISEITHELENLYDLIRNKSMEASAEIIQLTFLTVDHIRNLLSFNSDPVSEDVPHQEILKTIASILAHAGYTRKQGSKIKKKVDTNEKKNRTWHILIEIDDSFDFRNIKLFYILHDLFQLGDYKVEKNIFSELKQEWSIVLVTQSTKEEIEENLFFILDNCKITLLADIDIFNSAELEKRGHLFEQDVEEKPQFEDTDKLMVKEEIHKPETIPSVNMANSRITVDAAKLDTLIYLVSELVTTKSELILSLNIKNSLKAQEAAEKIDKLSKLFRDNALNIRLVPLHEMLSRFQRLVRDLSKQIGKKVEFEIHGADTELDKHIIETIADPVMHLIRNCIDHGIETPEERLNQHKNEVGIVKFLAYKSGNFVFIQISDDGKGIDKEKVIAKAISKGIISENAQLQDKDIFDLIFIPGFSTAESLTQVSGRGVGMDVVRRKLQEIRGEITIESQNGKGTVFALKLQQTISIIDTLLISVCKSKFAIPLEDIENCQITLSSSFIDKNSKQIDYAGELIPYLDLGRNLYSRFDLPKKQRIIVINRQDKRFAVLSDEIIGEYQAVIKPLGKTFEEQDFISGASILGDGTIALLLDTDKLKKLLN